MAIACAGCSSGASHDSGTHTEIADSVATGEYLQARQALIQSSMADLPAGRRPMAAFVADVGAECPGALRGTPLDAVVPQLRHASRAEVLAVLYNDNVMRKIDQRLEAADQMPQAAAVQRFATTVASIRWSNPRVAYLVNTFIEVELQRRHMPQLDVCRAIREWVASGYRKVPSPASGELRGAIARRWERAVAALGCGKFSPATPTVVLRALQPYQQPGAHLTTRDVEVMEVQLSFEESDARESAARSLTQVLGISSSVTKPRRRNHPRRSPHVLALRAPPGPPQSCSGKPDYLSEPTTGPVGAVVP